MVSLLCGCRWAQTRLPLLHYPVHLTNASQRVRVNENKNMGSKSRTGLIATGCAVLAFVFVLVAFVTPCWLETDGQLERPKFIRIGLWQVCFKDFEDPRHYYDTKFYSCWWVFEEEYYIINDILLPGFFVATQFFFTLCFTLLLISTFLVALYVCCHKDHSRYVLLLLVIGSCLVLAAVSGTIAVIIFGALGDSRFWMPNWEHNDISWSYALAVLGTLFLYISGTLYLVEGRVINKKRKREDQSEGGYHMETRKTASQTTI